MSCTGITIFDEKNNPILIDSIETKDKDSHGVRLKVIADKLTELREKYPTNIIVIERGFSRFNMATQVIYRVHGLINFLYSDCEQIYYPPKKVKEAILKGDATKKQVQSEINKKYPNIKFKNEDESDAFAIGLTYLILKNKIQWEKTVIEKKSRKTKTIK